MGNMKTYDPFRLLLYTYNSLKPAYKQIKVLMNEYSMKDPEISVNKIEVL